MDLIYATMDDDLLELCDTYEDDEPQNIFDFADLGYFSVHFAGDTSNEH